MNPAKMIGKDYSMPNFQDKIPWSSAGIYLSERPIFTLDPLLHAGAYYVQEASSMFLEEALRQCVDLSLPLKLLDLCAAPGGKSTLLQSLISDQSMLISNEVIKSRVNILEENITKWGASNVVISNNDPKHFQRLENYFDVIVIDAPCSGSGLFRRDPEAIKEWSENNVDLCHQRQQRILSDILPSLKDGGVLIYSTCSYSKAEDEDISNWITASFPLHNLRLAIQPKWGIVESNDNNNYGYRFYPDKVKGEGFFIACFRKSGGNVLLSAPKNKLQNFKNKKEEKFTDDELAAIRSFVQPAAQLSFIRLKEEVIALPAQLKNELSALQSALYIKKAGVKIGRLIGKELVPDHELALSCILADNIPSIEFDKITALQYLRKEEIKIQSKLKGWIVAKYEGIPLGWIKMLPNRINNYYPKEWRILMR